MRKHRGFVIPFSAFLCLFPFSVPLSAQDNLPEIFKKIEPWTVVIVTYDQNGKLLSQGSGFFISKDGDIITNRHVLEGADKAEIKTSNGKAYPITQIIGEDKEADIVRASTNISRMIINPLFLSNSIPQVGEHVAVIGSPLGLERTISDGIVSAVRDIPAFGKIIQISAPMSPGSSGSPVVNMRGEVIGIATFQMVGGQNLNFAIPSEKILKLKLDKRLTLAKWKNNEIETVKDADGNVYQTVKIGDQVWTKENLRTTKFNDGTPIPLVTDATAWSNLTTPGYCYYDNTTNAEFIRKYGALYNWYAVDTKKLAPKGWHVPTDADWKILENYLIANGYNWDGTTTSNKIAKSLAAKTDWETVKEPGSIGNDLAKNNKSGFSALPCGFRGPMGDFFGIGLYGQWWFLASSTTCGPGSHDLDYIHAKLDQTCYELGRGYSVRLLRD